MSAERAKKFYSIFFKKSRVPRVEPLVARRNERNIFLRTLTAVSVNPIHKKFLVKLFQKRLRTPRAEPLGARRSERNIRFRLLPFIS